MAWLPLKNPVYFFAEDWLSCHSKNLKQFQKAVSTILKLLGSHLVAKFLIPLLYKVECCVVLSFQSNVLQKATRTQFKLKDIDVKVIDFKNQNKIRSFKFVKSIET